MSNEGILVDALFQTDPALYNSIDAGISWRGDLKKRGARVAKFRRYEDGDHDSNMTDQMRAMLRLVKDDADLNEMNINYCGIVVDKMSGRLQVSEVNSDDNATQTYITELLARNSWDSIQGTAYRGAVRDGDGYVMIDPGSTRWVVEPAYDGFSGVVAIFDSEDTPIWACKMWSVADMGTADENPSYTSMRVVVYQPERITFWKGSAGGASVEPDPNIPERSWPAGKIPLVHFANCRDSYTQYGKSEIRKVIPPQDVLNRTLYSMVMASEFSAFKVAWSIGLELDKSGITPGAVLNLILADATTGKPITEMTAEQIAFLNACRVGEFGATDISQYTNQIEKVVAQICWVSSTPIYGLTFAGALSGDALRQLEIGLIGKCQRFQNENKSAVRNLIELTAAIQNSFRSDFGEAPKLGAISITWKSAEILDTDAAVTAIIGVREKAPGLFTDDFLRGKIGGLWGMTQAQILKASEDAKNESVNALNSLTGGAGNVPVI